MNISRVFDKLDSLMEREDCPKATGKIYLHLMRKCGNLLPEEIKRKEEKEKSPRLLTIN